MADLKAEEIPQAQPMPYAWAVNAVQVQHQVPDGVVSDTRVLLKLYNSGGATYCFLDVGQAELLSQALAEHAKKATITRAPSIVQPTAEELERWRNGRREK